VITETALAKNLKAYASTPLGTVQCGETYEFPFYILVIVAVVVGCIILAIFGFFVSNRRIRRAYKKLREQGFN
jgi:uncharacterized integral membrane protein